jgi:hypothetical protein
MGLSLKGSRGMGKVCVWFVMGVGESVLEAFCN